MWRYVPILAGSAGIMLAPDAFAADPQKVKDLRDHLKSNAPIEDLMHGYRCHVVRLKGSEIGYSNPEAEISLLTDEHPIIADDGIQHTPGLWVLISDRSNIGLSVDRVLKNMKNMRYISDGPSLFIYLVHDEHGEKGVYLPAMDGNVDYSGKAEEPPSKDSRFRKTAQSDFDRIVNGSHQHLLGKK